MTTGYSLFFIFTFGIYLVNLFLIIRAYMVHKKDEVVNKKTPFVSILVPAYNEEVTIVDSVWSLLEQDYMHYEIIVVDDGSIDQTANLLETYFGGNDMIKVISTPNMGKANALNVAAEYATGELLMTIDADTVLVPNALRTMVGKMHADSDAMSTIIGIHNSFDPFDHLTSKKFPLPHNFITRIQFLEYVKSYVIFRCSMRDKNAITVMSGACSLITKEMFQDCGGFKHEQLGEDMELTLNVHANGGKVQFLPETFAWTEAPETIAGLGKQRVRWYRGAIQALIKHRGLLFKKGNVAMNWFLLPYIWVSDVIGVWVEAISWVFLSYLLLGGGQVEPWYFLFIIGYYINSLMVVAFVRNKWEIKYKGLRKALAIATVEGIGYHFLFLFWSLKAQVLQITGAKNKWNKLGRVGLKVE